MSELTAQSSQANVGSGKRQRDRGIAIVSICVTIVALAFIAGCIVMTILVLDALPFYHIFPH